MTDNAELNRTAQLYTAVLLQLLPVGGYDTAPNTLIASDIYAHAQALAQVDIDAQRLLSVLDGIPTELLAEYEAEYGLPLKCTLVASSAIEERLRILKWVRNTPNVMNLSYLTQLLAIFGVELLSLKTYVPLQCRASCNAPVNTERLRYKVAITLKKPIQADLTCLIKHYLPAYLRIDIIED